MRLCDESTGQIYNPYGVTVDNAVEMAVCNEAIIQDLVTTKGTLYCIIE